jgi:hypothetical protein
MLKTVRLGTIRTSGNRGISVFCRISYTDGRLSIYGVEGPLPGGNCIGTVGQLDVHLRDRQSYIKLAPGWTRAMLSRFFDVWKDYHMRRGVPCDVVEFLQSLPDTDKQPAWV